MAELPPEVHHSARGITRTLEGFILQNETITCSPINEETDNQVGARIDEEVYDHRYDLSITAVSSSPTRTPPATADDIIEYDGKKWKVDSIEEAGTYNAKVRFSIRAHRYDNYPQQ